MEHCNWMKKTIAGKKTNTILGSQTAVARILI